VPAHFKSSRAFTPLASKMVSRGETDRHLDRAVGSSIFFEVDLKTIKTNLSEGYERDIIDKKY
jgi:hypothetical protein